MNIEIKKAIALAQHLGEEYFNVLSDDHLEIVYCIGEEEEKREEWQEVIGEYSDFYSYCLHECQTLEDWYSDNEDDYKVLTDDEANEEWDCYLDSYIDDCILHELPKEYRYYFDSEKWKDDAKHDGRGHSLSSYDGEEHEYKIEDEWLYVYRIN
jgi:hypothetical protein